jgi:hypothetical protein
MRTPVMNVCYKRNNFFFIGDALRSVLAGGTIHFTNPAIHALKDFIACIDVNYREIIFDLVHKTLGQ